MIKLFCNHKFGEVNEKGYQYCNKCNKAVFVGLPEHKCTLKIIDKFSVYYWNNPNPNHFKYVLQCTVCGKLTFEKTL